MALGSLDIHIIPMGYELERIVEPIRAYKADKVYFLVHGPDGSAQNFLKRVKGGLEGLDIDIPPEQTVNIFGYNSMMDTMGKIIQDEAGNSIHINLSSGSSISAVAGAYLAAMYDHVDAYYVKGDYSEESSIVKCKKCGCTFKKDRDVVKVKKDGDVIKDGEIEEIPVYSIQKPDELHLQVLRIIASEGYDTIKHKRAIRQGKLLELLVSKKLVPLRTSKELEDNEERTKDATDPNFIARVRNKLLAKMEEEELIKRDPPHKNRAIELTDKGMEILVMFSPGLKIEIPDVA